MTAILSDHIARHPQPAIMSTGACVGADPELWFPLGAGGVTVGAAARAVCNTCPAKAACLDWAIETGTDGIWGGTDERERRKLRAAVAPALAARAATCRHCGGAYRAARHNSRYCTAHCYSVAKNARIAAARAAARAVAV